MNTNEINLLYGGNDYAFDGMVTSLLSIVKHCQKPLQVYLLTMDLSDKNPKWKPLNQKHIAVLTEIVQQANPASKVILLDVTKAYLETLDGNANEDTSYTPFTLCRLLADKAPLPDKILYLDTDTVAIHDITELWEQDVTGYHFGAVLDHYGKVFIDRKYINAGMLLMNLKQMIADGALEACREIIRTEKLHFSDQTALNRVSYGKIKYLNGKFNHQKRLRKDTVIRHFAKTIIWVPYFHTRNVKPWQVAKMHKHHIHYVDDILEKYLQIKRDFDAK